MYYSVTLPSMKKTSFDLNKAARSEIGSTAAEEGVVSEAAEEVE